MKKLIFILSFAIIGCSSNEVLPVNGGIGDAGFNNKEVILSFGENEPVDFQQFTVYSGKAFLNNGIILYTDNSLTFILANGFYTYRINEVFYNTFDVRNGIVKNLNTRTY